MEEAVDCRSRSEPSCVCFCKLMVPALCHTTHMGQMQRGEGERRKGGGGEGRRKVREGGGEKGGGYQEEGRGRGRFGASPWLGHGGSFLGTSCWDHSRTVELMRGSEAWRGESPSLASLHSVPETHNKKRAVNGRGNAQIMAAHDQWPGIHKANIHFLVSCRYFHYLHDTKTAFSNEGLIPITSSHRLLAYMQSTSSDRYTV